MSTSTPSPLRGMSVEASQYRTGGKGTYAWIITVDDLLIRHVVVRGQVVHSHIGPLDVENAEAARIAGSNTLWRYHEVQEHLGVALDRTTVIMQMFRIPRRVYTQLSQVDETTRNKGLNEVFLYFGKSLLTALN